MDKNITYESAGVNLQSSEKIKNKIKDLAKQTYNPNVIGGVGGFGAMYKISGYREPILVSSTDPVGTKLMVAGMIGDYSHIGEDLVNACINDLIVVGAEPLFFLDYIATSQMIPSVVETIVGGISEACKNVGCALIGGETSEMPGVFNESNFDISGFVVGAVEADQMLDPINTSKAGDLLIGLPSNGLHTNGYSLVRHVFNLPNDLDILEEKIIESGETLGQALLKPHPSYYEDLKKVFPLVKVSLILLEEGCTRICPGFYLMISRLNLMLLCGICLPYFTLLRKQVPLMLMRCIEFLIWVWEWLLSAHQKTPLKF